MKGLHVNSILVIIITFGLSIGAVAQLQINTNTTADQMVEEFVGVGIEYFNATYQGADVAGGIFTMGGSAGLELEHGIFLSSGNGNLIPGPNSSSAASQSHGLDGHPILTDMLGIQTYDAAVLEFDFKPMHETVRFNYIFGSEEYNEYVGAPFNDIYGLFVSGPDTAGGFYNDYNFGIFIDSVFVIIDTIIPPPPSLDTVFIYDTLYNPLPVYITNINNGPALPGETSSGPCKNCEYFFDNVNGGKNIEYDGIATVLDTDESAIPVQPDMIYHFIIVIADAADAIFDSGIMLEGESFKSLGPAQFDSFGFLAEHNENLNTDVIGQIIENEVYLTVPDIVDVSSLVASFQVGGVYVNVNGVSQESGTTPNNFLEPVNYHLEGYNTKDWKVYVETVAGLKQYLFNQVKIGPNPSQGEIHINNVTGFDIRILDSVGKVVRVHNTVSAGELVISNLHPGIYYVQLEKDGQKEVRKQIVQ